MRRTIQQTMPKLLIDGGLFKQITTLGDMTANQLGLAYCLKHAGSKIVNSLVENYLDSEGVLTSSGEQLLGSLVDSYYGDKWSRIWNALQSEYDPLSNYDKNSTITDIENGTNTTTQGAQSNSYTQGAQSNSSTIGSQSNSQTVGGGTDTHTHKVSAFDSNTFENQDENTDVIAQRSNSESLGQRSDSQSIGQRQDSQSIGQRQDTIQFGHANTHNEHTTGNIGVTTSQQMLQSELELRKYMFYEEMFNDIDEMLTIGVYK